LPEEIDLRQAAGQWDRVLTMLEEHLDAKPDAESWRRAASIARRADDVGRAAAIWDAGWRLGVLKGREDLLTLIRLHLAGGTPARGAERLEEAIKSGELADDLANRRLLAQAWQAARDRSSALEAWQTLARRSDEGQDWLHLGRLALAWGEAELAQRALQEANTRGVEQAEPLLASLKE
jgi:tetratricopeptide (TPR) repeat protein